MGSSLLAPGLAAGVQVGFSGGGRPTSDGGRGLKPGSRSAFVATPPWSPLLAIAAAGLAFFALAEYADGLFVWRDSPDVLVLGYLEHAWHITSALVMAAAALVARAWLARRASSA